MARKKLAEITRVFENAAQIRTGISHVVVTMTQGDPYYEIQHLDDIDKNRQAIFFHVPLAGRSEQDALTSLRRLIGRADLYPHFSLHEGRIYLRKSEVPNSAVKAFLKSVEWLNEEHRSAICQLYEEKGYPFQSKHVDVFGKTKYSYSIFFHRDFRTIQQVLAECTFMILSGNGKPIGSAFILKIGDRARFLSAAHVGSNGEKVKIMIGKDRIVSATIRKGADIDMAILNPLEEPEIEDTLEMGNSTRCEVGDNVYVCGYPANLGLKPTVSKGHISKVNAEYKDEGNLIQISSAAINPNNSGGPVVDFQGNVIGILTGRALKGDVQNVAFAEPIERIFNLKVL